MKLIDKIIKFCTAPIAPVERLPMPEYLKTFLEQLPVREKDALWLYLDSNPNALHEMISIIGPKDLTMDNIHYSE